MKRLVAIAGLSTGLAACTCSKEPEPPPPEPEVTTPSLECSVVPDTDPREVRGQAMRGRAVFAFQRPVGLLCPGDCGGAPEGGASRCTGVLVTEDLVLTSRSCLGAEGATGEALAEHAKTWTVRFGFHERDDADEEPETSEVDGQPLDRFRVVEVVEAKVDDSVDYALLRLGRRAGRRWGIAPLGRGVPQADRLYVAHHPGGGPKRIAEGTFETEAGRGIALAVETDGAARGAPVFGGKDLRVTGLVRAPARCDEGVAAQVTPITAIRDASPTLSNLVSIRHGGNRTTLGTLEVYCGNRFCRRGPSFCRRGRKRVPCCDQDGDGKPDDPPTCWEANELGCAVECPAGTEVTWACSTGATESNRFVERVFVVDGETLDEKCGLGCDGRVTQPGGYKIVCKFGEYD